MGKWNEALEVARDHDRINLKTTHYLYAKHLEAIGKTSQAIKQYELSGTHTKEVPRMLFESQQISELERYIKQQDHEDLWRW